MAAWQVQQAKPAQRGHRTRPNRGAANDYPPWRGASSRPSIEDYRALVTHKPDFKAHLLGGPRSTTLRSSAIGIPAAMSSFERAGGLSSRPETDPEILSSVPMRGSWPFSRRLTAPDCSPALDLGRIAQRRRSKAPRAIWQRLLASRLGWTRSRQPSPTGCCPWRSLRRGFGASYPPAAACR